MGRVAILVSTRSEEYNNNKNFKQILTKAKQSGNQVCVIVGDALNRWNSMNLGMSVDDANTLSTKEGNDWCVRFTKMIKATLNDKLETILRWNDLINAPAFNYKKHRKTFDTLCNKDKVLNILGNKLNALGIINQDDFVSKKQELSNYITSLTCGEQGLKTITWEEAMASSILECTIKRFCTGKEFTENIEMSFIDFLFQYFLPNSYEHQAEEAVVLYMCLPGNNFNIDHFLYPGNPTHLLEKAHLELISDKKTFTWVQVKLNHIVNKSDYTNEVSTALKTLLRCCATMNQQEKDEFTSLLTTLFVYILSQSKARQPNLFQALQFISVSLPVFMKQNNTNTFMSISNTFGLSNIDKNNEITIISTNTNENEIIKKHLSVEHLEDINESRYQCMFI